MANISGITPSTITKINAIDVASLVNLSALPATTFFSNLINSTIFADGAGLPFNDNDSVCSNDPGSRVELSTDVHFNADTGQVYTDSNGTTKYEVPNVGYYGLIDNNDTNIRYSLYYRTTTDTVYSFTLCV